MKPLEFWVWEGVARSENNYLHWPHEPKPHPVHVIEKSAYRKAIEVLIRIANYGEKNKPVTITASGIIARITLKELGEDKK